MRYIDTQERGSMEVLMMLKIVKRVDSKERLQKLI